MEPNDSAPSPIISRLHLLLHLSPISLMVITLPDRHSTNLRPPAPTIHFLLRITMNQGPRSIAHRLVSIPLALDLQRQFVAFGGLVAREVDDARDDEDQEDHDGDHDAGDGARGEIVFVVVVVVRPRCVWGHLVGLRLLSSWCLCLCLCSNLMLGGCGFDKIRG